MKVLLWGIVFYGVMAFSPVAHAAVRDWPLVGQVVRVSTCVLGGTGTLTASLVGKLGAWGNEVLTKVSDCIQETVGSVTDTAVDVLNLEVPTPAAETHEEVVHE